MSEAPKQVPEKAFAARRQAATGGQPWRQWIGPLVALTAVIVFGLILHHKLRNDVWTYYTDGEGLRVAAEEKKERMVLWEDPQQHVFEQQPNAEKPRSSDQVEASQQRVEAAFSPDGATMVLTRWKKRTARATDTDADLYLSNWDGRTWSRPKPIVDLNTRSDERGAAFSRDGKYLYFSSDRNGGAGGYDLYVARDDGNKWTAVTSLGRTINSARNESGPAPSAEGDRLYFSSDRNAKNDSQDIFVAKLLGGKQQRDAGRLPPVPTFDAAKLVDDLNSPEDDIEAVLTSRGSYVFLASDRDRNSRSGFNLYLSRVIDGHIQPPQKVDVYIRRGNATDPAVRMEGFDLLFSADGDLAESTNKVAPDEATPQGAYRLYRSTTREVIGYTDLSRWELFRELMNKIQWLILLAIASLISLIYLLEKWRDITSLFHKCLAASAGVHLLLLMFMMFWLITQAIEEGDEQPATEVAISVDALAQEELAMESEQELAEVMDTTQMVVTKSEQEFQEATFEPQQIVDNPIPIVPKQFEQSLVSDFQQSRASESTESESIPPPVDQSSKLVELSPIELPVSAVESMESAELPNDNSNKPVDPTKGDFQHDEVAIQQVESQKANVAGATNRQLDLQAEAESVARSNATTKTLDPQDDLIQPTAGLEAIDPTPELEGSAGSIAPVELSVVAVEAMETAEVRSDNRAKPVDPTRDDFQPDGLAIQQVESQKATVTQATSQRLDVQAETESVSRSDEVTKTLDPQSDTIQPTAGLEATDTPNELAASDTLTDLAVNLPGDAMDMPVGEALEAPEQLDISAIGKHIKQQRGKLSDAMVEQLGGSKGTERGIALGLDWFTDHQESDGRWEMSKYQGNSEDNIAGVGLALLCYYGWGIKHGSYADNSKHDRHAQAVTKALDWLLKQQGDDGSLLGSTSNHGMYCHGIASVALCEGYGLTKDPKLKKPVTKAIEFILNSQHEGGGWRYRPREPGDLSVTGWQYLALHSARMADIAVPDEAFTKTGKFLDSVSGGTQGGYYGYLIPEKNKPTMTATGMFLRQLDRVSPTEPNMQESARVLKSKMLQADTVDFYFDYYATLALYQHQGPIWQEWNENLKEVYITLQKTTGPDKGSWDAKGDFVKTGGRVVSTGLAILSLEVYYRLLPMYGYDRAEDSAENQNADP